VSSLKYIVQVTEYTSLTEHNLQAIKNGIIFVNFVSSYTSMYVPYMLVTYTAFYQILKCIIAPNFLQLTLTSVGTNA
jgi:hypothetical protein